MESNIKMNIEFACDTQVFLTPAVITFFCEISILVAKTISLVSPEKICRLQIKETILFNKISRIFDSVKYKNQYLVVVFISKYFSC